MPEFAGQGGWWDGNDGTLGAGQAVAAHLGKGQPPQRAPAVGAHDQHIVRAAGQVHQHLARRPALDMRLHPRIVGNLAPHCHQRVPEPLAGEVPAGLPEFARRRDLVGPVTARQFPGDDRDQDRIERAGQALPCAAPARNSVTRRHGTADAIMGVARLASGELTAGAPLIVIRKPPSTSPKIMNIADQASRPTWLDPRPSWHTCQGQVTSRTQPDPSGGSSQRARPFPAGIAPGTALCPAARKMGHPSRLWVCLPARDRALRGNHAHPRSRYDRSPGSARLAAAQKPSSRQLQHGVSGR